MVSSAPTLVSAYGAVPLTSAYWMITLSVVKRSTTLVKVITSVSGACHVALYIAPRLALKFSSVSISAFVVTLGWFVCRSKVTTSWSPVFRPV